MIFKLSALTNSGIYSEWFNFLTFFGCIYYTNLRHLATVTSTLCLYCIHLYKRPIAVCKVNLLSITSKCKKNVLFVCLFTAVFFIEFDLNILNDKLMPYFWKPFNWCNDNQIKILYTCILSLNENELAEMSRKNHNYTDLN